MDAHSAWPLAGGALIGLAATIMLLFNGRVAGVSGILGSALARQGTDGWWRWSFLAGLILGGFAVGRLRPELFVNTTDRGVIAVAFAGLLVGYGTAMSGGCTSGHGVCGISRVSRRSLVATVTFMIFGFLAVQAWRWVSQAFGGMS